MNDLKNKKDSLRIGLSFFLILGAVLGSVFCNMMSGTMKEELVIMESSMVSASVLKSVDFSGLFMRVLFERLSQLFLIFLFAMTPIAPILFLMVCAYLGFSSAVMVCALTMDAGILGLVHYLIVISPQCLFYVPVIYTLVWWLPQEEKKLGILPVSALTVMVALGAAAESLFNPWLAAFLL